MLKERSARMLAALECAALDLREVAGSVQENHRVAARCDAALECAALDRADRHQGRFSTH